MAERITAERLRELRDNDNCENTDDDDVLLTRGRREWLAAAEDLANDLDDARAELAALRAILNGRTVPPSRAEVIAHCEVGGAWLVVYTRKRVVGSPFAPNPEVVEESEAQVYDKAVYCLGCLAEARVERVTPLGRDRRPCAWPTVTP